MADAVMMDACLVNWWDNDAAVRTRLRESECMLVVVEGVGGAEVAPAPGMVIAKSVANARANAVVLRAIMGWIASQVPGMKLPSIDLLLCAVAALYDKNRLLKDGQRMYQDAWGLRRLAQLVKARLYKQCPPKDRVCCIYGLQVEELLELSSIATHCRMMSSSTSSRPLCRSPCRRTGESCMLRMFVSVRSCDRVMCREGAKRLGRASSQSSRGARG